MDGTISPEGQALDLRPVSDWLTLEMLSETLQQISSEEVASIGRRKIAAYQNRADASLARVPSIIRIGDQLLDPDDASLTLVERLGALAQSASDKEVIAFCSELMRQKVETIERSRFWDAKKTLRLLAQPSGDQAEALRKGILAVSLQDRTTNVDKWEFLGALFLLARRGVVRETSV